MNEINKFEDLKWVTIVILLLMIVINIYLYFWFDMHIGEILLRSLVPITVSSISWSLYKGG